MIYQPIKSIPAYMKYVCLFSWCSTHLTEIILQLQLPAFCLRVHKLPALVQLLQAMLQALRALSSCALQQDPACLVQRLHSVYM